MELTKRTEVAVDRQMKKALQSRSRYDWEAHTMTRGRNAQQITELKPPALPATGTERISALLEEARRRDRRRSRS